MNEPLAFRAGPSAGHVRPGSVGLSLIRMSARRFAASAWVAAVFLLWVPRAVELPGSGLDASWVFGLEMAFGRHMQWGRDIVFTYGPLGVLDYNRGLVVDPSLWELSLGFAVIVNVAFALSLAFYLRDFDAHPLTWGLALAVVLLPVPTWALTEIEMILLTIIAFTLAVRVDRFGSLLAATGGSLVALQVLGKGTLLISGGSILAGFAVAAWITGRRRIIPPALSAFILAFLLLYAATGQNLGSLAAYVRSTFELIVGYGPALSNVADQPAAINPGLIRLCALALVPITAAEVLIAIQRRDRGLLAVTLICVPIMFLSFKEGFTRWHIDYFVSIAAFMQLLILIAILAPRRRGRWSRGPARLAPEAIVTAAFWRRHLPSLGLPLAAAALLVPISSTSLALSNLTENLWPGDTLMQRLGSYGQAAAMVQSAAMRDNVANQERASVLSQDPLPDGFLSRIGRASVDVMPWDIDVIAANQLNWSPRPVLQSYTAYTSYLDDMDAAFLRGPDAPAYILTTLRELDYRYALFEEPAAQQALLEGYRVDATALNWVLLRRAPGLCPCPTRELGSVTTAAGRAVTPPTPGPGERVFVRVRLDYSLTGRAANLVLDAGAIRVRLTSGETDTTFRLVPGTVGAGLLVSVFARTTADLATVYSGCDTSGIVSSISIAPDDPAMFASTVTYRYFAERTGPCMPPVAPVRPA
jgi:hypothetical protein